MSVGGLVVSTEVEADRVLIVCEEAAIYVERSDAARSISPGDTVWWQGRRAMWTPRSRTFRDYHLIRVGYSFPAARALAGGGAP